MSENGVGWDGAVWIFILLVFLPVLSGILSDIVRFLKRIVGC